MIKNIIVSLSFMIILTAFMIGNLIGKDVPFSDSERRKLLPFPEVSIDTILNGDFFAEFDEYVLDQFILRDQFRTIKAISRLYLFNQLDNNDVYIINDGIYKMEYPLDRNSIVNASKKFNDIVERLFSENKVYYSIVPDKNYFVGKPNGYLAIDYNELEELLMDNLNMNYIDLFDSLSISDYYRTDIHWKQENLIPVADYLLASMQNSVTRQEYTITSFSPFYGALYGQSALPIKPDNLKLLTNQVINESVVFDFETNTNFLVYEPTQFASIDPYNVFLGGPKALLTIQNTTLSTGKELVIFRDSFASSITPLLIEAYDKITLIDLRYISSKIIEDYIDFNSNMDVLFLYSVGVLNNSAMLK